MDNIAIVISLTAIVFAIIGLTQTINKIVAALNR